MEQASISITGSVGTETIPIPLVIGHEFVGLVEKVGSNVHDISTGGVVSGEGDLVCGRCRNRLAGRRYLCMKTSDVGINRDGAFTGYLSIPVTNVWYFAPNISTDILSCFDLLGNIVHTTLSFDVLGKVFRSGKSGKAILDWAN